MTRLVLGLWVAAQAACSAIPLEGSNRSAAAAKKDVVVDESRLASGWTLVTQSPHDVDADDPGRSAESQWLESETEWLRNLTESLNDPDTLPSGVLSESNRLASALDEAMSGDYDALPEKWRSLDGSVLDTPAVGFVFTPQTSAEASAAFLQHLGDTLNSQNLSTQNEDPSDRARLVPTNISPSEAVVSCGGVAILAGTLRIVLQRAAISMLIGASTAAILWVGSGATAVIFGAITLGTILDWMVRERTGESQSVLGWFKTLVAPTLAVLGYVGMGPAEELLRTDFKNARDQAERAHRLLSAPGGTYREMAGIEYPVRIKDNQVRLDHNQLKLGWLPVGKIMGITRFLAYPYMGLVCGAVAYEAAQPYIDWEALSR